VLEIFGKSKARSRLKSRGDKQKNLEGKKMTLKRLLALALATVMLLAFTASCKTDDDTPSDGGNNNNGGGGNTGDVIELSVLNYFSLANPGAIAEQEAVWDAFEAEHTNIKIIRDDLYEEPFHEKTAAHVAAGTLPDVIHVWPSGRSSALHERNLLLDLAPLVERDGLASSFIPLAMDPSEQHGGYLAMIPRGTTSSHAMFVNHEVLEAVNLEPAKTYSELVAQVPILKEAGYDTILMANEQEWVMQSCLFSTVAGRFMGENWHEKVLAGEAKFTDPDFVAALDFVKKMYDDGVLNKDTLAIDYGEGPGLFANNRAAYFIDGDWRASAFVTDASTGEALVSPERQEKISVTVFPEIDLPGVKFDRSSTAVLSTGWALNANLEGEKLEAAWTLLKWLVSQETITYLVGSGAVTTPSRVDVDYSSIELEPLQLAMANISNQFDRTTVVIDGVFAGPVFEPINAGLQGMALGTQEPEQIAELAQAAFEAWKESQGGGSSDD
jgi:raffinose/stachyose/melibiose transport system substrate-binding protein